MAENLSVPWVLPVLPLLDEGMNGDEQPHLTTSGEYHNPSSFNLFPEGFENMAKRPRKKTHRTGIFVY